jgi:hypothetical protein
MEVESWLGLAAPPIVENGSRILAVKRFDPNALRKYLHTAKLLGVEIPCHPSAQGIRIPCLPLPPSVSVAAQTVDLKTFSPLLRVAGAPVFPAGRETQGNAGKRDRSARVKLLQLE